MCFLTSAAAVAMTDRTPAAPVRGEGRCQRPESRPEAESAHGHSAVDSENLPPVSGSASACSAISAPAGIHAACRRVCDDLGEAGAIAEREEALLFSSAD